MGRTVKWTQEQWNEIARIQGQRNLTRKGAVQFFTRQQKRAGAALQAAPAPVPAAAKPKRQRKTRPNKAVVSTGLIAPELRGSLVAKLHKQGKSRRDIAVALGWAPGNGYGMVKALLVEQGCIRRYQGAKRQAR